MSQVVEFSHDEAGYFAWLDAHPDGLVVNLSARRICWILSAASRLVQFHIHSQNTARRLYRARLSQVVRHLGDRSSCCAERHGPWRRRVLQVLLVLFHSSRLAVAVQKQHLARAARRARTARSTAAKGAKYGSPIRRGSLRWSRVVREHVHTVLLSMPSSKSPSFSRIAASVRGGQPRPCRSSSARTSASTAARSSRSAPHQQAAAPRPAQAGACACASSPLKHVTQHQWRRRRRDRRRRNANTVGWERTHYPQIMV